MPTTRTQRLKALHDLILGHAPSLLRALHDVPWSLILDESEAERTSAILVSGKLG